MLAPENALAASFAVLLASCATPRTVDASSERAAPGSAPGGERLTLEGVVNDARFAFRRAESLAWLEGREFAVADTEGLGAIDAVSGERRVIAAAGALVPDGAGAPLQVESFDLSDDASRALLFTNSRRVWRLNTRGDFWVLDLRPAGERPNDAPALRQLGAGFPEATLQFAKLSPDGTRAGYVQANDLYVEDLESGARTRLTEGGSDTLIHGTFDWVYEEEFHLHDGWRWSPDGTRIAFWQLDASGTGSFPLVDELTSPYPTVKWLPYPKAGTTNSAARIGVISSAGGEVTWLDTPGDPRETYLARMEWLDAGHLIVQHLDRPQQHDTVLVASTDDGATEALFVEHDPAWVDVNEFTWLDETHTSLLWTSERDGWRRPYVASTATGELRALHDAPHDLVEVAHVDTAGGWLFYTAGPDDPTQRFLYRVPLAGGEPERLTPEDAPGWNQYAVAASGDLAIVTQSALGGVPTVSMIELPSHRTIRVLEDNATARAALEGLELGGHELFRVTTASGVELDGWALYPPDFDPARRWPVLFYVYGEPWGQTVQDRADLRHHLWHLYMTQRGYVVVSLDGRGTPAPRGREWRKCVYGAVGVFSSQDQAEGARALLQRFPWADPDRLGIWGWSGGGSQTLNTLLRYPGTFTTGIAVASVPDQRLYDTIYQERYTGTMGAGEGDAGSDGYALGSPIGFAAGLEDDLLLIHGTGDDNVHVQGVWQLVDELVALGKRFEMMLYPSRSHGLREGRGTREHLFHTMTDFLERTLPPGPR